MGYSYIEEDFRYATAPQVDSYTAEDRCFKPHMPGFALAQLLDQMNGQRLTREPQPCTFYIRTTGGTALWLARHWQTLPTPPELLLSIEASSYTRVLSRQLADIPAVRRAEVTDQLPNAADGRNITATVLAESDNLEAWYRQVESHPVLRFRPLLVYDRHRRLRMVKSGEYFMNSSIWVTRRYGY